MNLKSLVWWSELLVPSAILLAMATPSHADCRGCPQVPDRSLLPITQANKLTDYSVNLTNFSLKQSPNPSPSKTVERSGSSSDLFSNTTVPLDRASSQDKVLTVTVDRPAKPAAHPVKLAQKKIAITKIDVVGNTVIGSEAITKLTTPLVGKTASLEELQAVADSITQLYLDQGYITSRAVLVDQTIKDGIVQIRVVEGGLERIDVEGTERLDPNYIRDRIALAGISPIRQDKLEDQLRLLRADPLFDNVEASLKAGTQFGQSILTVRVVEANPFVASLSFDNYSPASVGSERAGVSLAYRNVLGLGDQAAASYNVTTSGGSHLLDFSYRVPLNPMNGTLQLRAAPSYYRITDPAFSSFGIRGNSESYEITYRQPLLRSPREEFALSLGFNYQRGQSFIFDNIPTPFGPGPDANGVSTTSVLKFGQDYVSRDIQGAWALRSQFSLGLGIFGATINDNPVPDGRFFSWLFQAQRVQLLSQDQILIIQGDLQIASEPLLASQQFVIGGGQSVRGFRQSARSGDNGFRFSIEDRIAVQRDEAGAATLQLAPFVDMGGIWNANGNPSTLPAETFLAAAGIGAIWEPVPKLVLRVDYAMPFLRLNESTSNLQTFSLYFSVNYQL